jgi:hypothetical protein
VTEVWCPKAAPFYVRPTILLIRCLVAHLRPGTMTAEEVSRNLAAVCLTFDLTKPPPTYRPELLS